MNKKQIIFIEPKPTVHMYRLARTLKATGRYETILISLSKVDEKFYSKAYNKLLVLELSHKIDRKVLMTLIDFFKKVLSRKGRNFLKEVKEMEPYMFNITGPDLFSLMLLFFLKKSPKIYYANDIWGLDERNFLFTKKFWIKGEVQKFCEKICFKIVDGALNKKSLEEFELLNYKIHALKMALSPSCLDEWTFPPKKKANKEIHIVFGGSPHSIWKGENRYIKAIKEITSQKIYFHTYGTLLDKKDNQFFIKESKENKYYCFHDFINPNDLNKEMSEYTYGIFPPFGKLDENMLSEQRTSLCGKMISYIEAGLPIIVNNQYEYMKDIIEKHGIGFSIDFKDLKNIKKILEQKDYPKLQKNVKKFQEEFKYSKKLKEIEEFYNKIIKEKSETY